MSAGKCLLSSALFATFLSMSPLIVFGEPEDTLVVRGRYLVEIGGCNDCHTTEYALIGGTTPESDWLLGDSLGYRGPWGTTYPSNLRTYVAKITEEEWIAAASVLRTRPPMPWWAVNAMTEDDKRAVYWFIKSLDPVESVVPEYLPPDKEPTTPYIEWPAPSN